MKHTADKHADTLRELAGLDLETARNTAIGMLDKPKKPSTRYIGIVRDLNKAKSAKEVERIMWNVVLAGEGMASINSPWQQLHKGL
jgi:hypothetical protein